MRLFFTMLVVVLIHSHSFSANGQSTVVYAKHEVALGAQGAIYDLWEAKARPIWQALKDEGKINNFGRHAHAWGDSYNHNTWVSAPDYATYEAAWDIFWERYKDALTEDERTLMGDNFIGHQDNIFTVSDSYGGDEEEGKRRVLMNFNEVRDATSWLKAWRSSFAPVLTKLVDSGDVISFGLLRHEIGDQYNMNWWLEAEDNLSFYAAWSKLAKELQANHMDDVQQLMDATIRHKDSLVDAY